MRLEEATLFPANAPPLLPQREKKKKEGRKENHGYAELLLEAVFWLQCKVCRYPRS